MAAVAAVLAAGTPQSVVDLVSESSFLVNCLRKAKLDHDLIQDVADACELNELNAIDLGRGDLTPDDAADKLFLMLEEAKALLTVCRRQCLRAGVNFGDGEIYEPSPDDEWEAEGPAHPAPPPPPPPAPKPAETKVPELKRSSSSGYKSDDSLDFTASRKQSAKPRASQQTKASDAASQHDKHRDVHKDSHHGHEHNHQGLHGHAKQQEDHHSGQQPRPSASQDDSGPASTSAQANGHAPAVPAASSSVKASKQHKVSEDQASAVKAKRPASADKEADVPSRQSAGGVAKPARRLSTEPAGSSSKALAGPATSSVSISSGSKQMLQVPRPIGSNFTLMPGPGSSSKFDEAEFARLNGKSSTARPLKPQGGAFVGKQGMASNPAPRKRPTADGVALQGTPGSSAATPPLPARAPMQKTRMQSYAKPTAAHKARMSKDGEGDQCDSAAASPGDAPSRSNTSPASSRAAPASATKLARLRIDSPTKDPLGSPVLPSGGAGDADKTSVRRSMFANISSSLLRPTKAFLAWTSGRGKHGEVASPSTPSSSSTPQPQEGMFKARPLPRYLRESIVKREGAANPGYSHAGTPQDSSSRPHTTTPEPFKLASMERHQKAQEDLARKIEEAKRRESIGYSFKAGRRGDAARKSSHTGGANSAANSSPSSPRSGTPVDATPQSKVDVSAMIHGEADAGTASKHTPSAIPRAPGL